MLTTKRRFAQLWLALAAAVCATAVIGAAAAQGPHAQTIHIWLQPGWNFVGWVGDEGAVADLYAEIDKLAAIFALDQDPNPALELSWRKIEPSSSSRAKPGDALWLRIEGEKGVAWSQEVAVGPAGANLRRGLNAVVAA